MSAPKILNPVTPQYYTGNYGLFDSALLRDGEVTPLAYSSGGGTDGNYCYGSFGDNVTYVDYTTLVWKNHNKLLGGNAFSYNLNRDGMSVNGKVLTEYVNERGEATSVIQFPKMNAKLFTFGFSTTSPSNQLKSMGELLMANENVVTLTRDFTSYEERWREKVKEIMLGDGTIHRVMALSKSGSNIRYEANCQFRYMSNAEVESLRTLKESGQPFYFQPDSVSNAHNIYKVEWTGPWNVTYTSNFKGAGYTINMQVKEV